MRSSVLFRLRRAAVVAAGAGAAVTLMAPMAHADITRELGPRSDCVTSSGNVIFCYTAYASVTVADLPTGPNLTTYASLHLQFSCTGVVPCQPIDQTVPLPTTGVVPGSPDVTLNTIYTIGSDFLCVNETCVPGFPIPILGPQVSGDLATIWVAGTAIPVRVPETLPNPVPIVTGVVGIAVGVVNNVTREVGIHLNLE
jgi:hypothetical protein